MIFNLPNINGRIIETGILATEYDEKNPPEGIQFLINKVILCI